MYSEQLLDGCVVMWIIMAELTSQTAICESRRAGNCQSDMIKITGCAKATVYRFVTKFDATGKVQRNHHNPREDRK